VPESNASRRDRRRRARIRLDRAEAVAEEASSWAFTRWVPGDSEVLFPGRRRRAAREILGLTGDGVDLVSQPSLPVR
jgi:hypothetical protein